MDKEKQLDDLFGIPTLTERDAEKMGFNPSSNDNLRDVLNKKKNGLRNRFKLIPRVLSKKERCLILGLLLIILGSLMSIPITIYYHFTESTAARGGTIEEGFIGEPRHINPLLSQSDADRDLVKLTYSGLLKYNSEGKLVPDLAKSYEISQDELNYTVHLREGIKWHDGTTLKADDIIFTIGITQNQDYSSLQRINWQGVELEKINNYTIVFKLRNKYAQFLNNLTLPILPQHKWENIKPINFALSELNLKPIGSGPYRFKKLQKDKSGHIVLYELEASSNFYDGQPFIDKVRIKFYESEDTLINAYNKNEVGNLSFVSSQNLKKLKFRQRLVTENIKMPRYFGVFFNQNQSKILSDKSVRLALAYATNKEYLIDKVLENNGIAINSPILEEIFEVNQKSRKYDYDKEQALEILQKAGWDKKDENGILKKGDDRLSIKLTTSTWPELATVAQNLKEQWSQVGIKLEIENLPPSVLQQAIRDRTYQMLLFGEILSLDPDLFSLWHSSQKRDPGLNLGLYDNKNADVILEEARKTLNPGDRLNKYLEFQSLVIDDLPALFLYSPHYLYSHSKQIKGFKNAIISTPADRFSGIDSWYIETRRVWR